MKGADGGTSFTTNTGIIQDYQTFYNLPDNTSPDCYFYSSRSYCYGGGLDNVRATSDGIVGAESFSH